MRKERNFAPESLPLRSALDQLSRSLLKLHKLLLDSTRDRYIALVGPIDNRYHLLQLVMSDPFFAWLHPLSQLIVRIDELIENEPIEMEAVAIHTLIREMLDSVNPANEFARQYAETLPLHPDLILAHADARGAVGRVGELLPRN